jgi:hypothetical protein
MAPNIETANFAASLGVDLANSTKTSTGLYSGTSPWGSATVPPPASSPDAYVGYRSGLKFGSGTFTFNTGTGGVIPASGEQRRPRGMRDQWRWGTISSSA